MNRIVVDTNVMIQYCAELLDCRLDSYLPTYTSRSKPFIESLSVDKQAIIDEEGVLRREYCNGSNPDAMNEIIDNLLHSDFMIIESRERNDCLRRRLIGLGMNRGSKDVIISELASSIARKCGDCYITTEDTDFFDPRFKNDTPKNKLTKKRAHVGRVCKTLRKENIFVRCIENSY